jgi:hypothetical protein
MIEPALATEVTARKILGVEIGTLIWVITVTIGGAGAYFGTQNAIADAASATKVETREREKADAEQQRETERIRADTDARLGRMERTLERIEAKIDTKADRDDARDRKRTP